MAPFVPNGVYKIRNVEFPLDVVGLVRGVPEAPILGFIDDGSVTHLWRIKNVGGGGNQITIESVSSPGHFASAKQFPDSQLFGSSNRTVWTVVKLDRGYYLQSPNAQFIWRLTKEYDYAPIVLIPPTGEYRTQWTFDRVGN